MRKLCNLPLLLAVVTACTDGGPTPASWELDEEPPHTEAHAGFEHQPALEVLVDPNSQPRLELVAFDVGPEDYLCPYAVIAHQFPSISDDGATLIDVNALTPPNADGDNGWMELTWLDADAARVEQVYSRIDDERALADTLDCEDVILRARARVAELNDELAQRSWRPLESLDAFFSEPGFVYRFDPEFQAAEQVFDELDALDRPIEVFWQNGNFIARVRGVKLLQSTPRSDWEQTEDEFCSRTPQIRAIEFDAKSRVALVRYNHSSGGCLCDDRDYLGRIELSAWLLDATERFSTAPLRAAARAAQVDPVAATTDQR